MKKPLVSVVVLNFNGKKLLKSFFESLYNQSYKKIEIIFVDNGSKDGSVLFVKNKFPQVKLISNSSNLGFSEACNQGAYAAKRKYIFFLNNDTRLDISSLGRMVSFLEKNSDISLAGPIVYRKNKGSIESAGLFPTFLGFFYNPLPKEKEPFEVFAVTGAAMLIRKTWFEKIGGFDKDFFIYSEDIDLCTRTKLLGGKIFILPECKVIHFHGQTSKKMNRSFVVFHATKNRILLLLKNFSFILLMIVLPIHLLLLIFMATAFFFSFKFDEAKAVFNGIFWNIKNLSSTIKKRKLIFKFKKMSEWDLVFKHFRFFPFCELFKIGIQYLKFW